MLKEYGKLVWQRIYQRLCSNCELPGYMCLCEFKSRPQATVRSQTDKASEHARV